MAGNRASEPIQFPNQVEADLAALAAQQQAEVDPSVTANQIEVLETRQATASVAGWAAGGIAGASEILAWATYTSAQTDLPKNFEADKTAGIILAAVGGIALLYSVASSFRGRLAGRRADRLRRQAIQTAYRLQQIDPPDIRTVYFSQ